MDKKKEFQLPADLTALSDADLAQHEADATAEFDAMSDGKSPVNLERYGYLADGIESLRGEKQRRDGIVAEQQLEMQKLRERVHPAAPVEPESVETVPAPAAAEVLLPASTQPSATVVAPALPTQAGPATQALLAGADPNPSRKLNPSLADIKRNAPATKAPDRRRESVLTASADIPGFGLGARLDNMDDLVAAMVARARTLPVLQRGDDTTWYPVASMALDPKYTLDLNATPAQINEVLTAAADVDALVAAGGWCSPSEISYDFFNIVCEDGMLDLPTVGINRGGIRYPISPTYNDIITGSNAYWSWTETMDIAALTGTGQSGTKVCSRVPCPTFTEDRLHCDGLCLTVGNLMEDAYPELIANHTKLLFAGQAHRINQLKINTLIALSTAVTGFGAAGSGVVAPVLGSLELSAIDYREKFAMCWDSVLEVLLPRWLRGAMRSDLRKRTGMDLEAQEVTDARLMSWFDMLNLRVQWIGDWQVRTAGFPGLSNAFAVLWPTTVQFMMFAAGTFVLGRGLQLNLGVVRDSVLNQTNDHTGEWMEECWLISKIGHESRLGSIAICTDGTTGAADLTACGV